VTVDTSNACVAWRATPAGVGGKNVGRLSKEVKVKGSPIPGVVHYGDLYMTFEVTFTKP